MHGRSIAALLTVALTLVGCDKKESDAIQKLKDAPNEFFAQQVKGDLAAARAGHAQGKDVKYKCAAALSYSEELKKSGKPDQVQLAVEAEKICGLEIPLAAAERSLQK